MDIERPAGYYAVIPASVRYDNHLPPNAKLLYGEISALTSREGFCFATNQYFADLYKTSTKSISRWVSALEQQGYIASVVERDESTSQITGRKIYLRVSADGGQPADNTVHTPGQSCREGVDKSVPCSLSNNNININIDSSQKESNKFSVDKQFQEWASTIVDVCSPLYSKLLTAFHGFSESRSKSGKPLRPGRMVTLLTNRLTEYASGSPQDMAAMLDEATLHGWQSVYPMGGTHRRVGPEKEREDIEWL